MMPANNDKVYTYVENIPNRVAIKSPIEQRLVPPPKTQRGHVFVNFVVTQKGVVRQPQIVKGVRADVDSAVVVAVRYLPDLAPGTQYGQPVNYLLDHICRRWKGTAASSQPEVKKPRLPPGFFYRRAMPHQLYRPAAASC